MLEERRNTVVNLMEQLMSDFGSATGREMRMILMEYLDDRSGLNTIHKEIIRYFLLLWLDSPDSIRLRGGGANRNYKTLVEQIWERMGSPQPEVTKKDTIRKTLSRKLEPFLRGLKNDPAFKEKIDELEWATMLHKGPYTLSRLAAKLDNLKWVPASTTPKVRTMLESVNPKMLLAADIRIVDEHHVRVGSIKAPMEQFSVVFNGEKVGSVLAAKQGPQGWILESSEDILISPLAILGFSVREPQDNISTIRNFLEIHKTNPTNF